eukprot:TRINITY_DN30674_c0_g1_i1.p1 TRINITY_DN30674_c0_g1~~TRINITY_DN30674_c0_g1_i1.p1  ORF type:complete len:378 (-),score=27.37 TRINITY_DN30674_c0_g1_i1:194-1327(-)
MLPPSVLRQAHRPHTSGGPGRVSVGRDPAPQAAFRPDARPAAAAFIVFAWSALQRTRRKRSCRSCRSTLQADDSLPPASALRPAKRNLLYDDGPREAFADALCVRDLPCVLFLGWGAVFSAANVAGAAGLAIDLIAYDYLLMFGMALGLVSLLGGLAQGVYDDSLPDSRPGFAKETTIVQYFACWGLATVLLAYRLSASTSSPSDDAMWSLACAVFAVVFVCGCLLHASVLITADQSVGPVATLADFEGTSTKKKKPSSLSNVESDRIRGLAICGFLGVIYMVDAFSIALGGSSWWTRVCDTWPAQRVCEQTTLLCGALAVEGCMFLHRLGRAGVIRFRKEAVPAGVALSVVLTLLPTAAQLYWHRADVSLWEFYFA